MARPSDATIKRLFATSHNLCAHSDCGQPLVEGGTIVGEVCHIKGEKPGAARYDPYQNDAERHAFENLICMCRKHHKIIDTDKENYSVERLLEVKRAHEASDSRRYVITDQLVQRLGEMLASEAEDQPRAPAATAYPDWGVRELFFYIRPNLVEGPDERRWEQVTRQVMDHFSTGRLSVWGRPIAGSRRGSLKRVDEPGFWDHARFTYGFLKEDCAEDLRIYHEGSTEFPDYADLQVNHAEALAIWPVSGGSQDDRTEIMLLDAARRVYSETRNDPAAEHAEAFGNTPEKILTFVYENLRVKLDELPAIIRELKSYGKG